MLDVAICIVDDNIVFQHDSARVSCVQHSPTLELSWDTVYLYRKFSIFGGEYPAFLGVTV